VNTETQSRPRILIIEDEKDIAELIRYNLASRGNDVEVSYDGEKGFQLAQKSKPDVLILDLMLPGMGGLEVCSRLRQDRDCSGIPVMMVTARGDEKDIVKGLELGADDYITKPFSPQILVARVQALLRRASGKNRRRESSSQADVMSVQGIEIHQGKHEVRIHGEKLDLTRSEFLILHFLAGHAGWVYTRTQIVDAIRGANYAVTDRSIDVQIVGLRKKLGDHGNLIETVRGVGYRFKE